MEVEDSITKVVNTKAQDMIVFPAQLIQFDPAFSASHLPAKDYCGECFLDASKAGLGYSFIKACRTLNISVVLAGNKNTKIWERGMLG